MSDLQLFRPNTVDQRRTDRALSRLAGSTGLQLANIEAKAAIEAAKLDAVAQVAQHAMQNIALISQVEQSLAQAVPHASGRLAAIGDLAAISMAGIVASTAHRVDRRF